jgi:voltage-gated potassium channel
MKKEKPIISEEAGAITGAFSRFLVWMRESFRDFRDVLLRERSLRLMGFLGLFIMLLAVGLWLVESRAALGDGNHVDSIWEALYLSFISGTTTGYGDIIPHTPVGKILTALIILLGMILTSVLTAAIASWFVEKRLLEGKGMERINWKNHTVICGWNVRGESLIESIYRDTKDSAQIVLVNDLDEDDVSELLYQFRRQGLRYVRGEFEHENVLERANVDHASSVVILADGNIDDGYQGADQRTVLGALAIKSMSPTTKVCAEIVDQTNVSHLKRAHVDHIVVVGEHNDFIIASTVTAPGVTVAVKELLSHDHGSLIQQVKIPQHLAGQDFDALCEHFREKRKAIVIGVVSEEEKGMGLNDILSADMSAIDVFIKQQFEGMEDDYFFKGRSMKVRINPPGDHKIENTDCALLIAKPEPGLSGTGG